MFVLVLYLTVIISKYITYDDKESDKKKRYIMIWIKRIYTFFGKVRVRKTHIHTQKFKEPRRTSDYNKKRRRKVRIFKNKKVYRKKKLSTVHMISKIFRDQTNKEEKKLFPNGRTNLLTSITGVTCNPFFSWKKKNKVTYK